MITLYRSAYCGVNRAPEFIGRSIDTKPTDVENGASYIDERNDYIWLIFVVASS